MLVESACAALPAPKHHDYRNTMIAYLFRCWVIYSSSFCCSALWSAPAGNSKYVRTPRLRWRPPTAHPLTGLVLLISQRFIIRKFIFVILLSFFYTALCFAEDQFKENDVNSSAAFSVKAAVQNQIDSYIKSARTSALRRDALCIALALDDRQLAAQVIISGIDGKGQLTPDMRILLGECPTGGIILFRYNLDTNNDAIRGLIAEAAALITSHNNIPPFIAVDHEGGSVNRFRAGVADLPPAASYWELARRDGDAAAIAQINADSAAAGMSLNALGFNLNLAPISEYLNDDNRDFLTDRSYGPEPYFIAEAAAAFIAGMGQANILCVLKHFPGSAGLDPHSFPSIIQSDKDVLSDLVSPIAALIKNGKARAIMVSHTAVPARDSTIASLSPVIMNVWLRQELGFTGLIICDDFSMASASDNNRLSPEAAAVQSLAAGADMLLVWPPDLRRTHRAIMAALNNGDLSRERLRDAAQRIIFEKLRMDFSIESSRKGAKAQ